MREHYSKCNILEREVAYMARQTYNPEDLRKAQDFEFSDMYGFEDGDENGSYEDLFGEELMLLMNEEGLSRKDRIYTAYKLGYMVAKGIL